MSSRRTKAILLPLLVVSALTLFPVASVYAVGPFTFSGFYGTGQLTTYSGSPVVEASSAPCTYNPTTCPYSVTYGGAIFNAPSGFTIGDISALSVMYFMKSGDCGNGAPRFSLWLDPSGSTEVWIYLGPGTYGGPGCVTAPWQSTGNLAGTVASGQSANTVFPNVSSCGSGNSAYTWSAAVACLGSTTRVYNISLDVDGGTSTNSQDAVFKCSSITINDFTFPPCQSAQGVPQFPLGMLAIFAIAIPALYILKSRASPKFP